MRRAVLILVAFLFASCTSGNDVHLLEPDDLPADLYGAEDRDALETRDVKVGVYFVRVAPNTEESRLEAVTRSGRTNRTDAEFAMVQLLRGADPQEVEERLGSAIPLGTNLLGVSIGGGVASVNLTGEFEGPAEDFVHILRIAQVVWTLTGLEDVEGVRFLIHGVPQPVIDQDGTAREMVSRARYSRVAARTEAAEIEPCTVAEGC